MCCVTVSLSLINPTAAPRKTQLRQSEISRCIYIKYIVCLHVYPILACTVYLLCQLIESICFLVCVSEPVLRPNISPLTHRGSGLMRYANIQIRSRSGLFHADRCNKISSPLRNTNVIYNHLCSDVFHSH